ELAQPAQRLDLHLPYTLARESQAAADLLERLRLRVDEAVAQDDHLAFAPRQRGQCLLQRFASQRHLDLLVRQRAVAGDEVAEDRVLLVADGLVEARRRARGGLDLLRLLQGQV